MSWLRSRAPSDDPAVDPRVFRDAMARPAVARELFLPLERAWWDGGSFTLGRWARSTRRPVLHGIRLQEPRPGSSPPPERDTQDDLRSLIASVAELRAVPGLQGLVLSDETLIGRQAGATPGKRLLFGLSRPGDGRFDGDAAAAAECHRVIRRAIRRAGYHLEHPTEPFDPVTGFAGLRDWAATIRLRQTSQAPRWVAAGSALVALIVLAWYFSPRASTPVASAPPPGSGASPPPAAATGQAPATASPPAIAKGPGPPALARGPVVPGPAARNTTNFAPGQPPPQAAPPPAAPAESEADKLAKTLGLSKSELEETKKLLKQQGLDSMLPGAANGSAAAGGVSARAAAALFWVGTIATLVGFVWLVKLAAGTGVGAVLGMLMVPGYSIAYGIAHLSRAWLPLLLHVVGLVLLCYGVYLEWLPQINALRQLVT